MSQITAIILGSGGAGPILTLTGNSGGAVPPTAGNINIVGSGSITVTGNPGTSTLTISSSGGGGITSITGDSGGAQSGPAITLTGGSSGGTFSGAANTLTMSFSELNLPTTASSSTGVININSVPALQMYGTNNLFLGGAGNFSLTGIQNLGMGRNALSSLTSDPGGNVAVGFDSLMSLSNSQGGNLAFGQLSLYSLTSGNGANCAFGSNALDNLVSGSYNVAIGFNSGGTNMTGAQSHNILLNAPGAASASNSLVIGNGTGTGTQELNSAFICGINGISVTGTAVLVSASDQLGIAVSSERYKDNIESMDDYSDDIMELRPVTFNYKNESEDQVSVGLIAEEVEEVMPSLVLKDKEGLPMTVKYLDLIPMLLNELQKVREELDTLREEFDASQEGD